MPSSVKRRQPINRFPLTPPPQPDEKTLFKDEDIDKKEQEEKEDSDISDTEIRLVKILNTFTKGKGKANDGLSEEEFDKIDKTLNWKTELRLKRLARENIRLISSEMTTYLVSHEFKVRGSTGNRYIVRIGQRMDCTCRDYSVRRTHCKHILFILLEELKITDLTHQIYQTLYPSDEVLKKMYINYHPTI